MPRGRMPKPSSLLDGYQYEPGTGRYRNLKSGRFVARTRITDLLGDALNANERTMTRTATAFHEGALDPRDWLNSTKLALKREYLQNAALGAGGLDRLTARDYGRIGGHLSAEYGRLASMAEQIAAGEVTLPQALNRITMYQGGARRMYYEAERENLPGVEQGQVRIERRVLGQAEHCEDCITYYEQGYQYEGVLPVPGDGSRCMTNCRCDLLRRVVPIDQVEALIGTKG